MGSVVTPCWVSLSQEGKDWEREVRLALGLGLHFCPEESSKWKVLEILHCEALLTPVLAREFLSSVT